MKKLFLFLSFLVLNCGVLFAQEDITITTYYPSPYGSYEQLGTNKLAVDIIGVAVATEYAAMANGDAHIGRSLIIGAGGGSGFAYDEGATTADGTLLVKGNVGVGTSTPTAGTKLQITDGSATNFRFNASASTSGYTTDFTMNNTGLSIGHNSAIRDLRLRTNSADRLTIAADGDVGIGTSTPGGTGARLDVIGNIASSGQSVIGADATSINVGDLASGDGLRANLNLRTNDTTRMTIDGSGRVGVGMAPTNALHVSGAIAATSWIGAGCEGSCETGGGYSLLYPQGYGVLSSGLKVGLPWEQKSNGDLEVMGKITGELNCRIRRAADSEYRTDGSYANCAADEYVISGGGSCENGSLGYLHESRPIGSIPAGRTGAGNEGWLADCWRWSPPGDLRVRAFAICCKKGS